MQKLNGKFRKNCRREILPFSGSGLNVTGLLNGGNPWIDKVCLFLCLETLADKLVCSLPVAPIYPARDNGTSAGRRALDDRHIQIA